MRNVLFLDELNINERNYSSLYSVCRDPDYFCRKDNKYLRIQNYLVDHFPGARFNVDSAIEWLLNGHISINRVDIKLHEICERFIRQHLVCYDDELAYETNPISYEKQVDSLRKHPIFLKNMTKVLEYWEYYFKDNYSKIEKSKTVVVFGGANILPSMMLALAKRVGIRVLVTEHFITGIDHFMEFRYSPVPNASYAHRYLPAELDVESAEIDKVRNKFAMNLNKNVTRLDDISEDVIFSEDYAVFIAQVSNDASMSEAMDFYSPVAKLLESVEWVLRNTPLKIVIKWHPWESKKVFVDSASSKQRALKYFEQLPEFRDRIVQIDHCNLNYLCDNAFAVMTICSQAAVEVALFTGKKTITLMPTYYDFMGISFPVKSVSELDWLNFQNTLSLNQYNSFLERLTWFVQCYLVCKYPSGEKRLVSLLSDLQKSNSLPKKPDQDWKGRLEPKRLERSELAPEAKRIAPALEVLSVEAGKDVFEKRLRSAPSEIEIPEKYVIARYLQNKKWAAPIWSLLAVPLSRLNRVLRK